jgi:hypothetical protein
MATSTTTRGEAYNNLGDRFAIYGGDQLARQDRGRVVGLGSPSGVFSRVPVVAREPDYRVAGGLSTTGIAPKRSTHAAGSSVKWSRIVLEEGRNGYYRPPLSMAANAPALTEACGRIMALIIPGSDDR